MATASKRPIPDNDAKWQRQVETRIDKLERDRAAGGGGAGGGDLSFFYDQTTAAAVWNINHGLNKFPSVTVVDSAGNQLWTTVKYIDANNVQVIFAGATAGRAYLN